MHPDHYMTSITTLTMATRPTRSKLTNILPMTARLAISVQGWSCAVERNGKYVTWEWTLPVLGLDYLCQTGNMMQVTSWHAWMICWRWEDKWDTWLKVFTSKTLKTSFLWISKFFFKKKVYGFFMHAMLLLMLLRFQNKLNNIVSQWQTLLYGMITAFFITAKSHGLEQLKYVFSNLFGELFVCIFSWYCLLNSDTVKWMMH